MVANAFSIAGAILIIVFRRHRLSGFCRLPAIEIGAAVLADAIGIPIAMPCMVEISAGIFPTFIANVVKIRILDAQIYAAIVADRTVGNHTGISFSVQKMDCGRAFVANAIVVFIHAVIFFGGASKQSCTAADLTLAVVTPDPVSVRDCAQLSRVLLQNGVENQKLIINRVPQKLKGPIQDLDQVLDGTGIMLQGVVPYSDQLQAAALDGKPLLPGKENTAFSNIAARLCGQYRPLAVR
jgi:hypothetical protein